MLNKNSLHFCFWDEAGMWSSRKQPLASFERRSGGNHEWGQWLCQQISAGGKNCKNGYNLTTPGSYLYYAGSRLGKGGFLLTMTAKCNNKCNSISPQTISVWWFSQPTNPFHFEPGCSLHRCQWDELGCSSPLASHNLIPKSCHCFPPPIRNPTPHFPTVQPHERPQALQEEDVI